MTLRLGSMTRHGKYYVQYHHNRWRSFWLVVRLTKSCDNKKSAEAPFLYAVLKWQH
jgi:hypothetical protein